jgi:hypothetical protein
VAERKNTASCVFILSDKSSGSSILQRELLKSSEVSAVEYTRHSENETLFWSKAVASLGLPQQDIYLSEIPIPQREAIEDLKIFLRTNLGKENYDLTTKAGVFSAWRDLCEHYAPVFIDKTPHYLHCMSVLDLIVEADEALPINFYFIALIRNPMDVLYSSWSRWNANPKIAQYEWARAYKNLLKLKEKMGDRVKIFRYEELVDGHSFEQIRNYIGLGEIKGFGGDYHSNALRKWMTNKNYGFQLSPKVIKLAELFGYTESDFRNKPVAIWPFYRRWMLIFNSDFVKAVKRGLKNVDVRRR